MGFLREFRSSLENPASPLSFPAEWLLDIFNGGRTDSGIRVSELTALQIAAVYSCCDLISGAMASMDLNVYEQLLDEELFPAGERIAFNHDIHDLLHDQANEEMTAYTWRKTAQVHALLWSNTYTEIERDKGERPVALWPRSPHGTKPVRLLEPVNYYGDVLEAGSMHFITTDGQYQGESQSGQARVIAMWDMIHVPGLSLDGRIGKAVIELTRQVMGLALATEKFGGKYFANGIRPAGVIELPQKMNPQALNNFKQSLQEAQGGENMLRPMVIDNGMKWTAYDVKPNEAQFLETRKHQREEIGAIFHVPLRMLGDSGKVNRASAEQEAIELVQYTLMPWVKAWQPELKRKLFPKIGRTAGKYFPGFDYQEMLTPDSESRGKLISLLKQWGIANTDEIRRKYFRWNPVGGKAGQTYWMPVNMMDAAHPLELAPPDKNAQEGEGGEGGEGKQDPDAPTKLPAGPGDRARRPLPPFLGAFQERTAALLRVSNPDCGMFLRAFTPVLEGLAGCEAILNPANAGGLITDALPGEVTRFINDYVGGMHKRFDVWKSDPKAEFLRAMNAIRISVARELATLQAKKEIEEGVQS